MSCAAPVSSTKPMPPWTCTPSEATSLAMSVEKAFCDGRQQRGAVTRTLPLRPFRSVERRCGEVADAPRGGRVGFHGEQHALHVGVPDDGARRLGRARRPALPPLAGIGERPLRRGLGDADALEPDVEPGRVHHREHAGEPAVLLADEPARSPALVAEGHGAGGRAVDAELVLDSRTAKVVARPVRQDLRHQEQRDAAGAGGRILQAGQHQMHDVVGEVVLAVGDVDLRPGDPIAAVAVGFGRGCAGWRGPSQPAAR